MTLANKETTFLIPHQGRTELLLATVASIQAQTQYDWVEKIIIVTKNQEPIDFPNPDKVEVLFAPQFLTISHQRNMGAKKANSPYLAFLDADIELDPKWLETAHQLLADKPSRVIISAMQASKPNANGLELVRASLSNAHLEQPVKFMTGRNLLLERKAFFEVGGFPEHLQTCEDYFFTEKVSEKGELFYTSQTFYYHLGEDKDYRETFKKERWRSAYNLLSLKGRHIPWAEWPSILLPFWFGLASLVLLWGLLTFNAQTLSMGLLAWLIPVGLYSGRLSRAFPLLSLKSITKFYLVYFAGRMLGTVTGIPKLWFSPTTTAIQTKPNQTTKVLEFICPAGFYGAERWIIALAKGALESERQDIEYHLAVTNETDGQLEVTEHFQALGLPCHDIKLQNRFDLRAITQLAELIKHQNIDVVHTHGYKSDIIGLLAARKAGVPVVCTPHGFENAEDWKLRFYLWLGGLSFRYFDLLCPLSNQLALDLTNQYGVSKEKITTIVNGVDLAEASEVFENTPKAPKEAFIIGYIGQLISRKNLPDMLQAFAKFKAQCPVAKLQLIGDGEDRQALEHQAKTLNIAESVEFLGFKNDRLQWLRQFDVFAMTSSLEGIPRCMMEAMAMEVPLSAFSIPGVDDLIKDGQTGLSCQFGDHQALADLWLKLYQDAALREQLASQAKAYVYSAFSAKRMALDYRQVFQQMTYKDLGNPLNTTRPTEST